MILEQYDLISGKQSFSVLDKRHTYSAISFPIRTFFDLGALSTNKIQLQLLTSCLSFCSCCKRMDSSIDIDSAFLYR